MHGFQTKIIIFRRFVRTNCGVDCGLSTDGARRCQPGERVYVSGDYPYDLPFLANYPEQLIVIDDWVAVRLSGVDNWLTEMLDGAGFDPEAGEALQYPGALDAAALDPGAWLLLPRHDEADDDWILVAETPAWALYRSPVSGGVAAPARP